MTNRQSYLGQNQYIQNLLRFPQKKSAKSANYLRMVEFHYFRKEEEEGLIVCNKIATWGWI